MVNNMKDKEVWLGVDLGTTNLKVVAFGVEGDKDNVITKATACCALTSSHPGEAVQSAAEVSDALFDCLKTVVGELSGVEIQGICFSGAMHSLLGISQDDQPVHPILTWADTRSTAQADVLRASGFANVLYQRTGTPVHSMSPLTKLLWIKENQQHWANETHRWVSAKSWALFLLTGDWVEDEGIASASGLLNLRSRDWDELALEQAGVTRHQLARVVKGATPMKLTEAARLRIGLTEAVTVYPGGSDGALANVGMGVTASTQVALSLGTSGALRTTFDEITLDSEGRLFCYLLDEKHYVVGGAINNAGLAIAWLREQLFDKEITEDEMISGTASIEPGANGLFFLPYLSGERAPVWQSGMRATLHGLTLSHSRLHITRAILEGVAFQLSWILRLLDNLRKVPSNFNEIQVSGGATRSEVWMQILSDSLNRTLVTRHHQEVSCRGAVRLVQKVLHGRPYPKADEAELEGSVVPSEAARKYEVLFEHYRALHRTLYPPKED